MLKEKYAYLIIDASQILNQEDLILYFPYLSPVVPVEDVEDDVYDKDEDADHQHDDEGLDGLGPVQDGIDERLLNTN